MDKVFLECTDELMRRLSEHGLAALQAIYASGLTEAKQQEGRKHVRGKQDTLVTRRRLLEGICEARAAEQTRRR